MTGASDDDPSGIATYAQAGSTFGLGLVWTALVTFPLMAGVQEIADRTALATGESLGALAKRQFGAAGRLIFAVLLLGLFAANALNISADLVAVGQGMNLLHAGPTVLWALIAGAFITALLTTGSFDLIARIFKYLCFALLAYIAVLFATNVDWSAVAMNTIIPHPVWSSSYAALLVAVLGTTISPYLFFWQNLHRVEEMRDEPEGGDLPLPLPRRRPAAAREKTKLSRFDVFGGMLFSNLVMFSIIVASASAFARHGHPTINSAAQAAQALRPIAGSAASVLFALGFIGSGMLAIPILAGSASAGAAGLFGHTPGFSRSPRRAPLFYLLVAAGTIGGAVLTLVGANPIQLLVVVALINGIAAAPFLIVLMLISRNRRIMRGYANGRVATVIGWAATVLMLGAAVAALVTSGIGL